MVRQAAGDEIAERVSCRSTWILSHLHSEEMLLSDDENANIAFGERLMVDLETDGVSRSSRSTAHTPGNAISLETMDQLDKALDGAEGATALVLTGAGDKAFVSGGDLKELGAAHRIGGRGDGLPDAHRLRNASA
ncbi:hypothetical protein ACVWWN_003310 [Mycobacterium sp. URHB0021]